MPTRYADAVWEGTLREGKGKMSLASGAYEGAYSFTSRFEDGTGTNPEELIAAAHAGCFSMALANGLTQAGHPPDRIQTRANVHLAKGAEGFSIPRIDLITEAKVPGLDAAGFQEIAEQAKKNCPVSKLLAAAEITLDARLT